MEKTTIRKKYTLAYEKEEDPFAVDVQARSENKLREESKPQPMTNEEFKQMTNEAFAMADQNQRER